MSNFRNKALKHLKRNKVLIVLNNGDTTEIFNIRFDGETVSPSLESGSVGIVVWK